MTVADRPSGDRVWLLSPAVVAACRALLSEDERSTAWNTATVAWDQNYGVRQVGRRR
jgi:hypothetical protein